MNTYKYDLLFTDPRRGTLLEDAHYVKVMSDKMGYSVFSKWGGYGKALHDFSSLPVTEYLKEWVGILLCINYDFGILTDIEYQHMCLHGFRPGTTNLRLSPKIKQYYLTNTERREVHQIKMQLFTIKVGK